MFTDIMGVMKNVEIPATEEQVGKSFYQIKLCLMVRPLKVLYVLMNLICTFIQI